MKSSGLYDLISLSTYTADRLNINQRPDQYTYQVSVYLPSISILTKYQYTDKYT